MITLSRRAATRTAAAVTAVAALLAAGVPASEAWTQGDHAAAAAPAAAAPLPDPGRRGPLATSRLSYHLGDTALKVPGGYQVELTGEVTFPTRLGGARRPVVVLLHGAHDECGNSKGEIPEEDMWPCRNGYRRIPSERGYRPLADQLASHGMVVVSVAANGVNAAQEKYRPTAGGAHDRGYLVLAHLDLWRRWSGTDSSGPFGKRFRSALDLGNVALVGHSRGGEGVVSAVRQNRTRKVRYGIRAVVPLAPVNFTRMSVRGTASLSVLPYCDGEIEDLQGVHYFDDAAAGPVDSAPHALLTILGANHNFFNSIWSPGGWEAGTYDDAGQETLDPLCGPKHRLTAARQVQAGVAYVSAFLRARLQGATYLDVLFRGDTPTPASVRPVRTITAFSAPAGDRLLINDVRRPSTNTLGGAVTATGFDAALPCGAGTRHVRTCFVPRGRSFDAPIGDEPHLTTYGDSRSTLTQLHLVWSRPGASWHNALPPTDLRGHRHVTLRVARDPWAFSADPPRLAVTLRDTAGRLRTVPVTGTTLSAPVYTGPSDITFAMDSPHALAAGAAVPLSAFTGVDLAHVDEISLTALSPRGDITVADLSVQR